MGKKIRNALIFSLIAFIAIFVLNFFLPRLMPGDPLANLIGADEKTISQEEYDALYKAMGLDKSLGEQFMDYLSDLGHGKLGYSYHRGNDVGALILEKLPRTLQITVPAWLFSSLLGCSLGLRSGMKRGRAEELTVTGIMAIFDAMPTFLLSISLLIVFSFSWGIFPSGGLNSPFASNLFLDRLWHLFLPVLSLTLLSTPKKYFLMRNEASGAMNNQYMVYARAKGISDARLSYIHLFPNVSNAFILSLGTSFGHTIAGSIVIETIFSIDGIGLLTYEAINDKDYPLLQGSLLLISLTAIISNFLADIIAASSNPATRREHE